MLFSSSHIWVEIQGEQVARIGISDFAQSSLEAIMFVNLPEVGETLCIGERFGDIESLKTVSDLISPLNGNVLAINEDLLDMPYAINEAPYDNWLVEANVECLAEDLMDRLTYEEHTKSV